MSEYKDWRIVKDGNGIPALIHLHGKIDKRWYLRVFKCEEGWKCTTCDEIAPEGIQAAAELMQVPETRVDLYNILRRKHMGGAIAVYVNGENDD